MKYETFRKACVDTDGTDLFPYIFITIGLGITLMGYATYNVFKPIKED